MSRCFGKFCPGGLGHVGAVGWGESTFQAPPNNRQKSARSSETRSSKVCSEAEKMALFKGKGWELPTINFQVPS